MRNPFAVRRTATLAVPDRDVPHPAVMAGVEFLVPPTMAAPETPVPEVALCGIDPRVPGKPGVPQVQLVLRSENERPDSVEGLLADLPPGDAVVRRLTFDVRGFRDVLESRGGWNLLAQLVRDPADRVTNAVFRAAIAPGASPTADARVLAPGDVECAVRVVGEGDTVAGRCRHELGRARLSLTPFLAESARMTRRLAEALAHPRDRGTRRCLEHALADAVADVPLGQLISSTGEAPSCAVPGAWSIPAPRDAHHRPAEPVIL